MPWAAPKHCPQGHPPFTGSQCPVCASARKVAADARRGSARERGYDSRWDKARKTFLAAHPLCRACGEKGVITPATVVDHVTPHKGDQKLFWSVANWQPLCRPCHDRKTATEDGGFGRPAKGVGGIRNFSPSGPGPAGASRAHSPGNGETRKWDI